MNKRKAIKILKRQKQIFIEKSYTEIYVWRDLTQSFIADFVGKDSPEYSKIKDFRFGTTDPNYVGLSLADAWEIQTKIIVGLIDNCIEKVELKGVQSSSSNRQAPTMPPTKAATTIAGLTLKTIIKIAVGIIIGISVLILWDLYKTDLINYFSP